MPKGIQESHFFKGPWCAMSAALNIPFPEPAVWQPGADVNVEVEHLNCPQARFVANRSALLAHPLLCNSISKLTRHRSLTGVRQMLVIITSLTAYDSDVAAEVMDLSGSMTACVHRRVLEEHGTHFAVGAAVIVKKVSVFSPTPDSHYLNIVPACVSRVFPPGTPLPPAVRSQFNFAASGASAP